jgi:hypothetical protein
VPRVTDSRIACSVLGRSLLAASGLARDTAPVSGPGLRYPTGSPSTRGSCTVLGLSQPTEPKSDQRVLKRIAPVALAVLAVATLAGCSQTTETGGSTSEEEHTSASAETTSAPSKEATSVNGAPGTGAGATTCGEELHGSAHTSCPFAQEVYGAFLGGYLNTKTFPGHVTATSPVTHRSYYLGCVIYRTGEVVECSVGDADVTFPISKVEEAQTSSEHTARPEGEEDKVGSTSHATDEKFCEENHCIGDFTTEEGAIVECSDDTFSHAGGISGACSGHGGESSSSEPEEGASEHE